MATKFWSSTKCAGRNHEGRIAGLSAESLNLTINGSVSSFSESGVQKITHQHHASLLNGRRFRRPGPEW